LVYWFDRHDPRTERELGGKNTSLGIMTGAGLPVPPGFAVSAAAYRATVTAEVGAELRALVRSADPRDNESVEIAAHKARDLILGLGLGGDVAAEIEQAYAALEQRCGPRVPVAVRSSATCEDQPDASFAGEHDTYLWVRGAAGVKRHVLRCWASLFSHRAISYRRQMNYSDDGLAMSVGVQQMVLPRASGVAFTLNPVNGDRSQVAIDAAWGLGEGVVSGAVTPDNYLVDKVLWEITKRTVSHKALEFRLGDNDRVIAAEVEPQRCDLACLSDDEVRAVARLARRAEKHYGCPQDVEWALDPNLPDGENIVLLQSRPETVWSRVDRTIDGYAKDTYASIVHTLLHPVGKSSGAVC
jgi:pyruvate,water dikinase